MSQVQSSNNIEDLYSHNSSASSNSLIPEITTSSQVQQNSSSQSTSSNSSSNKNSSTESQTSSNSSSQLTSSQSTSSNSSSDKTSSTESQVSSNSSSDKNSSTESQTESDENSKNNNESSEVVESTLISSDETIPPNNNFDVWHIVLYSVIAILVFLIAILITIIFKKKKQTVQNINSDSENCLSDEIKIANIHNIGKRDSQQDSFGISDITQMQSSGVLAVVADGMGGLEGGAEISSIITTTMLSLFREQSQHNAMNTNSMLLKILKETNENALQYISQNGNFQSGSTVVAVHIQNKMFNFISVGDSRIYLMRNGTLTQINREHTYGAKLDEQATKGEISFEEAQSNFQRKALTSYIGMGELELIDYNISPIQLVSGDKILLMSDGVFGTLSNNEMEMCMQNNNIYDGIANMENNILQKNNTSQDNFTAIIVEID